MNLLIVDDDPSQLRLWDLILTAAGHRVRTAASPREAGAELSADPPDVLLMDLRMPRAEDGFALIRAASACPGKVIVLSGWPEDLDGRPEAEHVARILLKPIRTAALLDALRSLAPLFLCLLALAGGLRSETFPFHVPRPAEVVAEIEMQGLVREDKLRPYGKTRGEEIGDPAGLPRFPGGCRVEAGLIRAFATGVPAGSRP